MPNADDAITALLLDLTVSACINHILDPLCPRETKRRLIRQIVTYTYHTAEKAGIERGSAIWQERMERLMTAG